MSLLLCPFVPMGILSAGSCDIRNSTISKQLVAGLMIVMHIKSICDLFLPLRLYGPMRSTHNDSHGMEIASFVGSFSYLCCMLVHLITVTLLEM